MSHLNQAADRNSIILGGYRFIVGGTSGEVQESLVNIHGRKVNQGDPGPDDHPINSTWIQSDWTGGGQVVNGHPDIVTGRFDFGDVESMYAHGMSNSIKPDTWNDPTAGSRAATAIGEFDDLVWAAWAADLRWYDSATNTWTDIANDLTSAPSGKGQVFTPNAGALIGTDILCIPLGTSFDYIKVDKSRTNVAKSAVDFCVTDNKLFRIGSDGYLEYTTDLATWAGGCYIPDGTTPRHLDSYMTSGGDLTPHVTTDAGVWAYDFLSQSLLPTQLQYPRHPDQGRGSCVWRSDLYTSVGDGMHRFNRSTIAAMGMDRDDGLPSQYRGAIVDIEPSYNCIYALVSGSPDGEQLGDPTVGDLFTFDAGDDYMTADPATPIWGLLMRWNGFGWHYVDSFQGTGPTTVFVSSAESEYGVWYAEGSHMRRIKQSRTYMNLKDTPLGDTQTTGTVETCWYDFGWQGQTKVLKVLDFYMDQTSGANGSIQAFYKVDNDENPWVAIGTSFAIGKHSFYFNPDAGAPLQSTSPTDYSGTPVERVKLKFYLYKGTGTKSRVILRWFSLSARKMLRPVRTFRMVLELEKTNDYTSQELRNVLLDAIRTPGATDFVYQNETLKVDMVALEFRTISEPTKITYIARVNLIETNETITVG